MAFSGGHSPAAPENQVPTGICPSEGCPRAPALKAGAEPGLRSGLRGELQVMRSSSGRSGGLSARFGGGGVLKAAGQDLP